MATLLTTTLISKAATNLFTEGTSTSWLNPANWGLNHAPTSTDALLLNDPQTSSTLDGSYTAQTLSFDTGADFFGVDANSSSTTAQTLTLTGGTNALGGIDLLATSATTTGQITLGGATGQGILTVAFGSVNGTINVANSAATLIFGANARITGSNGITKNGAGTLTLVGQNTYTGTTTIQSGRLRISQNSLPTTAAIVFTNLADGSVPTLQILTNVTLGSLSATSGTVATVNIGTRNLTVGTDNTDTLFRGTLNGSGDLIKVGTGTFTIGVNTVYNLTGNLQLQGGTLSLGFTASTLSTGVWFRGGTLAANGNTLTFDSSITGTVVSADAGQDYKITTSRVVTFNDPLTDAFAGAASSGFQEFSSTGGVVVFGAANTYTGLTTVSNGTLQANIANAVPITSAVTLNTGGILDLHGFSDAIGSLAGVGSVTLGSGTLTTGADNTSTNFSGSISGAGAVIKNGTGAWTLAGANTYTGATTVNRGRMVVSGSLSGTASVTVGDGTNPATLGGNGTITPANGGAFTVKNAATLAPAIGNASGLTLNAAAAGTASLVFQPGSTFQLSMANNQAGSAGAPSLNDYSKLTIGTGVSVTLGGNIVTSFDGLMNNGDLFTIILNSGTLTGAFANTTTAAPNSAGSSFRFSSNGLLWDINYAWSGSTPLAGVDPTTFEQTTGGHNVALLLVSVPEPGCFVSFIGAGALLLGRRRFRRN